MYAEDWVYAPALTKTVEILKATHDKILFMKAEESHSGSHAAHAALWSMTTEAASLIRMGCHPLAAVLYLKRVEARARGETISRARRDPPTSATSRLALRRRNAPSSQANPVDVEDWGMLTVTFSDGTKGIILSGDIIMGGVRKLIRDLHKRRIAVRQHHAEQSHGMTYMTDETRLGDVYFTEKVDPQNRLAVRLPRRRNGPAVTCRRSLRLLECVATGPAGRLADLDLAC